MKTAFSTGDAAKATGLSQQTIIRSIDSGRLIGYRVPNSKFRRVSRSALTQFMNDNGIPHEYLQAFDKEHDTLIKQRELHRREKQSAAKANRSL